MPRPDTQREFKSAFSRLPPHEAGEIERAVTAFARQPNGGLIVTASTLAGVHRDLLIALAARHKLPAVYPVRYMATSVLPLTKDSQIGANLRVCADEEDRADFDRRS
jgi:hypothetical protein